MIRKRPANPHHTYVFANRRADRFKVLVYDGAGIWLCTRRLQAGSDRLRLYAATCGKTGHSDWVVTGGYPTGPTRRAIAQVLPCRAEDMW